MWGNCLIQRKFYHDYFDQFYFSDNGENIWYILYYHYLVDSGNKGGLYKLIS